MKKLIIFDFDGTLVESEHIAAQVFPRLWTQMGVPMTADYFLCHFVGTAADADILKQTVEKLPPNGMAQAQAEFEKELRENLHPVRGIPELLTDLANVDKCIASNSSMTYLKQALEKTQLGSFFKDQVYSAEDVRFPKPAADLFLHAAHDLGYKSQDCLVIEDSVAGITAARAAGMKVIGTMGALHFNEVVKSRLQTAQADLYVHDILELRRAIFEFLK